MRTQESESTTLALLHKHRGIVDMYLKTPMPSNEYMQESNLVILTAVKEYDPEKGALTTCIGNVARRRNMQLLREKAKRIRERKAEEFYGCNRLKEHGHPEAYRPEHRIGKKTFLEYPEQLDDTAPYNIEMVHRENLTTEQQHERKCRVQRNREEVS